MAEFVMPSLGADMSAGTLIAWLKQPGDRVERGEIIAIVHTDKADIEVEVFARGVVQKLLVEPGAEVPTGTVLALIGDAGEAVPEAAPVPVPALLAADGDGHRLLVSPSARQLADELGVDLSAVEGSGPGGRIHRKDVERAKAAASPTVPPRPAVPTAATPPGDEAQAAMRRAIAASMSRSKREIPHVYLSQTIDLSRAVAWLADENTRRSVPDRLLLGVLLVKAVAVALRGFPELNAKWEGDQIVRSDRINVGNAIFLRGGGLVAPAIHDADQCTLDELMRSFRDLVARARSFSLRATEMSDPTITVTSIGERGVEAIFPIIVPPQVAIVGFGKVVDRPWVSSGQLLVCPVVTATVSVDHRAADGHVGSAFLAAIDQQLQEPEDL